MKAKSEFPGIFFRHAVGDRESCRRHFRCDLIRFSRHHKRMSVEEIIAALEKIDDCIREATQEEKEKILNIKDSANIEIWVLPETFR